MWRTPDHCRHHPGIGHHADPTAEEFADKRDFDDESAETIFKTLLGSTIVAVAENPGRLAEESALKPLFAAISWSGSAYDHG